jgi:hypothetical protein
MKGKKQNPAPASSAAAAASKQQALPPPLLSWQYADITLQCEDGHRFEVTRSALAAGSTVFADMFEMFEGDAAAGAAEDELQQADEAQRMKRQRLLELAKPATGAAQQAAAGARVLHLCAVESGALKLFLEQLNYGSVPLSKV